MVEGGVTVGLLHTGRSYADDMSADGVLYHYPSTNRAASRDVSEVAASKAAGTLGLPVFVVATSPDDVRLRDVHRAWVSDWDDATRIFLILFGDAPMPRSSAPAEEDTTFELFSARDRRKRLSIVREGQQAFKFAVLKRYGAFCAVCDVDVLEGLDAAHIVPKNVSGADHPANGLVLCSFHHVL